MYLIAFTILCIFLAPIKLNAVAVFYTICFNTDRITFPSKPMYTGSCSTVRSAAYICNKDENCVIFSKSGSQCSFFSKGNYSIACQREISGRTMASYFRMCNCKFGPDPWTKVGYLYLHVTPEMYTCDKGQAVCSCLGGTMAEFHNTTEMDNAYTFITDSVFVGIDYTNGKYVWRTTGIEVSTAMWAPNQPLGDQCVQLWITEHGLDDTTLFRFKNILCEKRAP